MKIAAYHYCFYCCLDDPAGRISLKEINRRIRNGWKEFSGRPALSSAT